MKFLLGIMPIGASFLEKLQSIIDSFLSLLPTLGLTILIEYPIVQTLWLVLKKYRDNNSKLLFVDQKLVILPVLIVNILTNPAINCYARILFREFASVNKFGNDWMNEFWFIISLWEIVIFLVEGLMYKFLLKTKLSTAMLLSLCSNGISYLSSFIL